MDAGASDEPSPRWSVGTSGRARKEGTDAEASKAEESTSEPLVATGQRTASRSGRAIGVQVCTPYSRAAAGDGTRPPGRRRYRRAERRQGAARGGEGFHPRPRWAEGRVAHSPKVTMEKNITWVPWRICGSRSGWPCT